MKHLMRQMVMLMCLLISTAAVAQKYQYDTVPGDPLKVKMYTLPNGLRLYMSVNKDYPRIQTNIAVRVGGKNDPAETTGLAHYFEHLMFKGTPEFGTSDYAAEKPMLDQIEQLFEVYRVTQDSTTRAAIYHQIDSISYEASRLAIPNEYDKLMSAIGASGTNAYTSQDETCYVENIPSNQIDNWARIQSMRFKNPVLRGFHTELETIYEEKNMSLTKDSRKAVEKLMSTVFVNHPYGTQTVLGSQEHLKNPSITNVKNYHDQWYVPNNMAIVMSGDFDPDTAVDIITKYFGDMQPNPNIPAPTVVAADQHPQTVTSVDVVGQEAERVYIAWWTPAAKHSDTDVISLMDNVMSNGSTGLIDLDINQQQKMLGAGCGQYTMADQSMYLLIGMPQQGQSLDEVRDLLLAEAKKLRDGDFDEDMLHAIINNYKLSEQAAIESNDSRVSMIVSSFINGTDWADEVNALHRMSTLTKADLVDVANKYLRDDNYVVLYKRQGVDDAVAKIDKPNLTPIVTNRDKSSPFLEEIQRSQVEPIEPVFVDYDKDLTIVDVKKNIPLLYKHNNTNDIFTLTYVIETGTFADMPLAFAPGFMDFVGTKDKTPEQIQNEFYSLACSYSVSTGGRRSYITLTGLSENMPAAMALMEDVLANGVPDKEAWALYAGRLVKSRADSKSNQSSSYGALRNYAQYGPEKVAYTYSNEELLNLDPTVLTDALKRLRDYDHRIIYYGPMSQKEVVKNIKKHHYMPKKAKALPEERKFPMLNTPETVVYLAPYDSNQIYMYMFSNDGERFDMDSEPLRKLYNSYFGGDMSSIVFQEMRESRSLAYSASAGYSGTSRLDVPYTYGAFIATQNDKMMDAITAFDEIINDMPQSEKAFRIVKDGIDASIRTSRTIKDNVAWSLINAQDLGYEISPAEQLYKALPGITLDDVVAYQQGHVKGRTYVYCILGRIDDLDLDALGRLGRVVILTPEQTFGY